MSDPEVSAPLARLAALEAREKRSNEKSALMNSLESTAALPSVAAVTESTSRKQRPASPKKRSVSPKKHRSPSPALRKHRSPSPVPRKRRSPTPPRRRSPERRRARTPERRRSPERRSTSTRETRERDSSRRGDERSSRSGGGSNKARGFSDSDEEASSSTRVKNSTRSTRRSRSAGSGRSIKPSGKDSKDSSKDVDKDVKTISDSVPDSTSAADDVHDTDMGDVSEIAGPKSEVEMGDEEKTTDAVSKVESKSDPTAESKTEISSVKSETRSEKYSSSSNSRVVREERRRSPERRHSAERQSSSSRRDDRSSREERPRERRERSRSRTRKSRSPEKREYEKEKTKSVEPAETGKWAKQKIQPPDITKLLSNLLAGAVQSPATLSNDPQVMLMSMIQQQQQQKQMSDRAQIQQMQQQQRLAVLSAMNITPNPLLAAMTGLNPMQMGILNPMQMMAMSMPNPPASLAMPGVMSLRPTLLSAPVGTTAMGGGLQSIGAMMAAAAAAVNTGDPIADPLALHLAPGCERLARRVHLALLGPSATEPLISDFLYSTLVEVADRAVSAEHPVIDIAINPVKQFAFLELRTIEDAEITLAMDGIIFQGGVLRVRRPKDYVPLSHGTGSAKSKMWVIPGVVSANVEDGPDKLYIGHLPLNFSETQVQDLLKSFGPLKSFLLQRDPVTAQSTGVALFAYQDSALTDLVIQGLSGVDMGEKKLVVHRAPAASTSVLTATAVVSSTRVLALTNLVTDEELTDPEMYDEMLADITEECARYGTVQKLVVPRGNHGEAGRMKVFVMYSSVEEARKVFAIMHGRTFEGRVVSASYMLESHFNNKIYDA